MPPRPRSRRAHLLALFSLALLGAAEPPSQAPPPPPPPPPRPVPPTPGPSANCLGRWTGWGRGSSGEPWSIDMVVTAEQGGRCGTIEYPSLGCGGYLVNCRRHGNTVTWTEVYTHNPGTCAPAGVVDGVCDATSMDWLWTGWERVRTRLRRSD